MRGLALAVVWAWVATACTIELPPRPRPPEPPPSGPTLGLAISSRTLANGLRVVLVRDPTATEVQVTMRYQVGAQEDGASPGIAHLVEHLMFEQQLLGQPLFTHLEDTATYFNAATTFDATTYVARAPATAIGKLLTIEAVRLADGCGSIDDAQFTREREVVVHELEQRDSATEIYGALHRALFPDGHPYRRTLGGTVETVRAITRDQACSFAARYYGPNNAVLVISGNLATRDLDAALGDLVARVRARPTEVPPRPALPVPRAQHLEIATSIDRDVLVVAWPLPTDPEQQVRVRAIASALPSLVEANIKGTAILVPLGDRAAPMLGIAVIPGDDEAFKQVVDGTRRAVAKLPRVFQERQPDDLDDILFDRIKHGAAYGLYAVLEDGGDRDDLLASYVAAGRDPRDAITRDLAAVGELTREEASDLAAKYLAASTPTVVTLKAGSTKKRGDKISIRKPIHDLGRRRTPVDPSLAARAADAATAAANPRARTRTLPNGLKVVLLPVTAVPTFDARLVFGAGTADEPADQRGVALFAAHTLTWNLLHLNDALVFVRAGGMRAADVSTDRSTFSVQGLDANLDTVLAGLRRWVRDGVYDDSATTFAETMHSVARRTDDQGALTDAWRGALFGAGHPYVSAGLVRHANPTITLAQAEAFRDAYFTPDNATLVIAGHFDAAVADRWIDYLFADWRGKAAGRRSVPASSRPATIAKTDDTTLVQVRLAIPVGAAVARAPHLVVAEILNDIAHDVRYQLAATYTFDAELAETRQASFLVIGGWVDASSTSAALELVRDRVAELARDRTAAARAFVVARAHVAARLRARVGSAGALADRVERDVELGRDPLSELNLASAVDALTIGDMTAALGEVDLSRAVVLMDGPEREVSAATKVLGRTATFLVSAPANTGSSVPGVFRYKDAQQRVLRSGVEPALTARPMPRVLLELGASGSIAAGSGEGESFTGYTLSGEIGYRYGWTNALGARLELGRLSLDSTDGNGLPQTTTLVPVDALALWHLGGAGRTWGELMVGYHFERRGGATASRAWRSAPAYAVQGGLDVIRHGPHRLGLSIRWESTTHADLSYRVLSLGVVYRR